jgi:hypothetical protein
MQLRVVFMSKVYELEALRSLLCNPLDEQWVESGCQSSLMMETLTSEMSRI